MSSSSSSSESEFEEQGNWETCVVNNDYEIYSEYPYNIRRKGTKTIVKESIDKSNGYIALRLNGKKYRKHRIISLQFIKNDDPEHKTMTDHINHDRTDYHISNLRWVSRSENNRNKSSNLNVVYEYKDKIDDEAIEITDYGRHQFEFYYYVESEAAFYYYTGVNYRKLHININKYGTAYVYMINTENKNVQVCLNKFKKLYGIDF